MARVPARGVGVRDALPGDAAALAVAPQHRGQGLARSLVSELESWARDRGCALVEVTSAAGRVEAHAAYRALGFDEATRRFMRRL